MSWGDGVPTYADELAQRLSQVNKAHHEEIEKLADRLALARTAWREIRKASVIYARTAAEELDRALEIL